MIDLKISDFEIHDFFGDTLIVYREALLYLLNGGGNIRSVRKFMLRKNAPQELTIH